MAVNPFIEAADALAAHGRQERGRVVRLLTEAEREEQLEVAREAGRRGRAKRGPTVAVRGADGRFVKRD